MQRRKKIKKVRGREAEEDDEVFDIQWSKRRRRCERRSKLGAR